MIILCIFCSQRQMRDKKSCKCSPENHQNCTIIKWFNCRDNIKRRKKQEYRRSQRRSHNCQKRPAPSPSAGAVVTQISDYRIDYCVPYRAHDYDCSCRCRFNPRNSSQKKQQKRINKGICCRIPKGRGSISQFYCRCHFVCLHKSP